MLLPQYLEKQDLAPSQERRRKDREGVRCDQNHHGLEKLKDPCQKHLARWNDQVSNRKRPKKLDRPRHLPWKFGWLIGCWLCRTWKLQKRYPWHFITETYATNNIWKWHQRREVLQITEITSQTKWWQRWIRSDIQARASPESKHHPQKPHCQTW